MGDKKKIPGNLMIDFLNDLYLTNEEKPAALRNFYAQNLDRIGIFALLAIPVSLAHIIIFGLSVYNETANNFEWSRNIILVHSILGTIFLSVLVFIMLIKKGNTNNPKASPFITHFGFITILITGAIIAIIDQQVTTSITPYLLVCLLVPLIFIVSPFITLFYYLLSFVVFTFMLPLFQSETNAQMSIQVNALSAVAFGAIFSMYMWKVNVLRYRQDATIKSQNEKLEKQNKKLQQLTNELRDINDSKDRFFSILAHDLRSPVHGFLGLTEVIADDLDSLSDKQIIELASTMKSSATNLSRLLNNLLEWSQIQQGNIVYNPRKLHVAELVNNTIPIFMVQIHDKSITINTLIDSDLTLYADRHMIEVIVRNLISNAIKFTPQGGFIQVSADRDLHGEISLSVTDNGVGMNETVLASLFNISSSINRRGTKGELSTGIGLILCQEFAQKHHGRIKVESTEGKGSTFTLKLPHNFSTLNS